MERNRIDFAMDALHLSAVALSRKSSVDASIINRWRKGSRSLTTRSVAVRDVAAALIEFDTENMLLEHYAPYREAGGSDQAALTAWLTGTPLKGLPARIAPAMLPTSGEYTVEHVVYLGQKGFRKAAMAMLDYVLLLPPGQTLTVLCQGKWEWFISNIPFALHFIAKLKKAVERGTMLRIINRKGFSLSDSAAFAGYWLTAHLKGYLRSLYYEGELPRDIRFVGSIPGYWSGRVEEDPIVEDNLYVALYTDPRQTQRDAALCEEYAAISHPASQYSFLPNPLGDAHNVRLWDDGPLPPWGAGAVPDGSFYAITRVPGIGIATRAEARDIAGSNPLPPLPAYLIRKKDTFAPRPHKIILCREDVREALQKERRMHEVFSAILHRRAFVPHDMLEAQLKRLLAAMEAQEDFEVALMPRSAFKTLGLEMVCFRDSITIGYLQDLSESVFCNDEATAGSFYGYIGIVWNKLHKGWKRKVDVRRTLRKWLAGEGLGEQEKSSSFVRNWSMTPKE